MTRGNRAPVDYRFCPECGRASFIPYYASPLPVPEPNYHENSSLVHLVLFGVSFLIPLLGFLLGFPLTDRTSHLTIATQAGCA